MTINPHDKFYRLTVRGRKGSASNGDALWECVCICGNIAVVRACKLRNGNTRSCGCLLKEHCRKLKKKKIHGHASREGKTPTYRSWQHMVERCTNPNSDNFRFYGGTGIRVCKRWLKFENFLKDMGTRPTGTVIGRHGDTGNYTPSNCSWQTHKESQATRRGKQGWQQRTEALL